MMMISVRACLVKTIFNNQYMYFFQVPYPPSYSITLAPHSLDLKFAEFFGYRTHPLPPRRRAKMTPVSLANSTGFQCLY